MAFTDNLVTKAQAARILGVSLATFDRLRKRSGIHPVKTILEKPIFFQRPEIEALRNGNGAESQEGYRLPANGTLVIKHDLPPARTAKELLAALKPQVRAVETILKEKGIVTMPALRAERKRARAGK